MGFEVLLVTGGVLAGLSGISLLHALIEGRRPLVAALVVMIASGILVMALLKADAPLTWRDVPDAFVTVIAAILN